MERIGIKRQHVVVDDPFPRFDVAFCPGLDFAHPCGDVQIHVPRIGQSNEQHARLLLLQPQEIGVLVRGKRSQFCARHEPRQFSQRMNGVDAHHLVVHVALKTIQAPKSSWFRTVACQSSERDSRAIQRPFNRFDLHFHRVIGVHKWLLTDPFQLTRGPEGFEVVEVPDFDVGMVYAVFPQQNGHSCVRGVQGLIRKQHLVGQATDEQRVVVEHRDFRRTVVRRHPRQFGSTHLETALVGHTGKDILQKHTP